MVLNGYSSKLLSYSTGAKFCIVKKMFHDKYDDASFNGVSD